MKQNKKQNWIKQNFPEIILIFLILIFASVGFLYSKSDKYFCSHNPDKCVEETWVKCSNGTKIRALEMNQDFCDNYDATIYPKFRKKTQDELLIDDCNKNPRDDKDCKCGEIISGMEVYVRDGTLFGIGYPLYANDTLEIYLKSKCLKSRPKTECERGNPDWVFETKCIQTKEVFENYTTKELKCPEIINNPIDIIVQHIPCSSELIEVTVYNFVKKEICISNQTICRKR